MAATAVLGSAVAGREDIDSTQPSASVDAVTQEGAWGPVPPAAGRGGDGRASRGAREQPVTRAIPVPEPTATTEPTGTPVSPAATSEGTETEPSTRETATPGHQGSLEPFIAYTADSFFRTPLPTSGVPVTPDSSAGIAFANAANPNAYPTIRGVGGNAWGMGYAMGTCADPVWRFAPTATLPASQAFLATTGFHAPADFGSRLPVNADSPIVVIDRCGNPDRPAGFTVWGANVHFDGTRVLQSGGDGNLIGGSFAHDSNGLDRRNPGSDSQLNERSRGVIPDSMVIRDDLLAAALQGANGGTLGHVLEFFWPQADSSRGFVSPMVGNEKPRTGFGAQGQRIRVQESWTPPAGCTGAGLVIARTLQRYGAYLGDTSGGNAGIKAQQGSTFPGLTQDALRPCISWNDMEFIPAGWGA